MEKVKSKFYYCYSSPLKDFLEYDKKIKSLEDKNGIHYKTNKPFWVFKRSRQLDMALFEWKENKRIAIEIIKKQNNI